MASASLKLMFVLLGLSAAAHPHAAFADPVADFYRNKQLRVIIGFGPGGGYDLYARLITRHMSRYIPGNPSFVPQNMPGAGSMVAAQHMVHRAPRDGSVLATISKDSPMNIIVNNSPDKAEFARLVWLGNPNEDNHLLTVWAATGVKSIDDAKTKELSMGATAANGSAALYPLILNSTIGTKFRIIAGFPGSNELNLALERGEIDGRGSDSWVTLRSTKPDWLRDGKIKVLMQIGFRRDKEHTDIPLMIDLARNPVEHMLFEMLSSSASVGASLLTTADVPADRVAALRAAFDATMKDAQFLAEAEYGKLDINPVRGEDVQVAVGKTVNAPKDVVDLLMAATVGGKTLSCPDTAKDKGLCGK